MRARSKPKADVARMLRWNEKKLQSKVEWNPDAVTTGLWYNCGSYVIRIGYFCYENIYISRFATRPAANAHIEAGGGCFDANIY